MTEFARLLNSIATKTADYRSGELAAPTPEHVQRWINQFDEPVRQPILAELEHVLGETYLTKANVMKFISALITNAKLVGENPKEFWEGVKFLNIQTVGNSQREMLKLLSEELLKAFGLTVEACGQVPKRYFYLDDVLFTGGRIRNDLSKWITHNAPADTEVIILTIGQHRGGQYYADRELKKHALALSKTVRLSWWYSGLFEDRKRYIYSSDVLRPVSIPNDMITQQYVKSLGVEPELRTDGSVGDAKIFSSLAGRALLEQEFLKKGAYIRSVAPNLNEFQRPLGNMVLKTVGFGSMIVTFRNCPNNAPLVFWASNPWYPLFARKTN